VTAISVILEAAKVAMSADPLGTVAGVQLLAVNQSALAGLSFQVALPAEAIEVWDRTSSAVSKDNEGDRRDCIPSVKAEKVAKGKTKK